MLGKVYYLIVSIPDLCPLSYFCEQNGPTQDGFISITPFRLAVSTILHGRIASRMTIVLQMHVHLLLFSLCSIQSEQKVDDKFITNKIF